MDEESVGDWIMEFAEEVLKESGYSSPEEWSEAFGRDFNEYVAEIA